MGNVENLGDFDGIGVGGDVGDTAEVELEEAEGSLEAEEVGSAGKVAGSDVEDVGLELDNAEAAGIAREMMDEGALLGGGVYAVDFWLGVDSHK